MPTRRPVRSTTVTLLRAAHPEPAAAVTAVACLLAVAVGHRPAGVALVTASVAASQLAVGWSNDALDAARDARTARTDKPVAAGLLSRRTVAAGAVAAGVVTVPLALAFGPAAASVAALGLLSALAYNWPLKFTVLSPLPYAVSFAALPAFVVVALPARPPVWLLAAGALLGAGAHFANALPDLAGDLATGVRGAPHRIGSAGSAVTAAVLLLAATAVLALAPAGLPRWVGAAAMTAAAVAFPVTWYARRRAVAAGRRAAAPFRAVIVVALIAVGLLLASGRLGAVAG